MSILFATSEYYPLVKTGGLADVSSALPGALLETGQDVTVVLPGYGSVLEKLGNPIQEFEFTDHLLPDDVSVREYSNPHDDVPLLVVCSDALFNRDGGPYTDSNGSDWPDNAQRYAHFCRAVVNLLSPSLSPYTKPFDIVHCNDWQTGLVPAFVALYGLETHTVFTIHNLAYQGIYDRFTFDALGLPPEWWQFEALEFYGNFSFLKAGVVFSNWVTTVSPTYSREILEEPLACGMSGLLQHYQNKLVGILNGVDYQLWDPATDPHVTFHYDSESIAEKLKNKLDLQRHKGLRLSKSAPLIGVVSRLVHQKGMDWVLSAMEQLQKEKVQWVILGSGDGYLETRLRQLAEANPKTMSVTIGYNEALAHQIEASADLFAMPSRYEPCGLNQIYSLRYGTLPIVRATGGLIDTVVDVNEASVEQETATGFVFTEESSDAFLETVRRATAFYSKRKTWNKIQIRAMAQNFDWSSSARSYLELYEQKAL
jgi:starch synthase